MGGHRVQRNAGYVTSASFGTQEMPDWLGRRANTHAEVPAVRAQGVTWSYRALYLHAQQLARQLQSMGVDRDTPIALLARDGLAFAWGLHAIMQCRVPVLPLNWRLTVSELAWQVRDGGAQVLLVDDGCAALARPLAAEIGSSLQLYWLAVPAEQAPDVSAPGDAQSALVLSDVHTILYTSGTTGRPKGAMLTYGNHWWSAMTSAPQLGVLPGDEWLVPLPLFHMGGLAVLLRSVIYGTTAVIHDGFDAATVNHTLDTSPITMMSVVPTMLQRMLAARDDRRYSPHLRCVLLGGSGASPSLLASCERLGVPVAQSYGLTETASQAATLAPADGLRKPGSSGKPLLATEIAIIRDDRRANGGEHGEIIVRGPTVSPGYWRRPEATEQAFHDGWLHTGDSGFLDEEGYLYVLDRRSDLIVSGGENIYPAELESVLMGHPQVVDAGVVGRADDVWGQVPVAFVALAPGATANADQLIQHCRQHLAGYKVPKRVEFLDALPRNASGKLLRRSLREWVQT